MLEAWNNKKERSLLQYNSFSFWESLVTYFTHHRRLSSFHTVKFQRLFFFLFALSFPSDLPFSLSPFLLRVFRSVASDSRFSFFFELIRPRGIKFLVLFCPFSHSHFLPLYFEILWCWTKNCILKIMNSNYELISIYIFCPLTTKSSRNPLIVFPVFVLSSFQI